MKKLLLVLILLAKPCLAIPTFVQGATFPNSHGFTSSDYLGHFQNTVLNGNTIVVFAQGGLGATSVTDDKTNTYTQAGSTCTGNQALVAYVAKNVTNGPRDITVHWTSTTFTQIAVLEFYNVDQTTPVDTMSVGTNPQCGTGTGTALTTGSGTPTTSGALAVNFGLQDAVETQEGGAFTKGSACGGFTFQLTDLTGGQFVQTAVTSGACNADATQNVSQHWTSLALFLRPATAGTAPSSTGIRVLREQHHSDTVPQATPILAQWPGTGNLWVLKWVGADPETITTITDTQSNTWTEIGSVVSIIGSGKVQAFFCKSCTANSSLVLTINFSGTTTKDSTWHLVDVTNFDTTFTPLEAHSTGTMSAGTTLTESTITPSSANGLIIAFDGHASNTSLTCTTGFFDAAILTPTPATSPVDENNSNCNFYNPTTSNFIHESTVDIAVGAWADKVLFFKNAATASGSNNRSLLGVGK